MFLSIRSPSPSGAKYSVYIKSSYTLSTLSPSLKPIMSSNIVLASSYFNDNTVTFTSDHLGRIKIVGPDVFIVSGNSVEGVSGFSLTILYWTAPFFISTRIPRKSQTYIAQFPATTWQPGETVTIDGPTTSGDNTVLTLTGSQTTTSQTFLLTDDESLSAKQKADIAEAEVADWSEFPSA